MNDWNIDEQIERLAQLNRICAEPGCDGCLNREARRQALISIRDQVVHLQQELADYEQSFALYDKASLALANAYKAAHPEFPQDAWPDATKVNVWAAEQITSGKIATRDDVKDVYAEGIDIGRAIGKAEATGSKIE